MVIDFWFTPSSLVLVHGQRITSLNLPLLSFAGDGLPLVFCANATESQRARQRDPDYTPRHRFLRTFLLFFVSKRFRRLRVKALSWRKRPAEACLPACLPPPRFFRVLPRSRKEKSRDPALILLSSAIPAPAETPLDGTPARSSLSFSWGLLNSRTRAKRRTRRALRRAGHSTHWIIFRVYSTFRFLLTTRSLFKSSHHRAQFSRTIYFSNKEILLIRLSAVICERRYPKAITKCRVIKREKIFTEEWTKWSIVYQVYLEIFINFTTTFTASPLHF